MLEIVVSISSPAAKRGMASWSGVGAGVGDGVGEGVGDGVGEGVGDGVGDGVGVGRGGNMQALITRPRINGIRRRSVPTVTG